MKSFKRVQKPTVNQQDFYEVMPYGAQANGYTYREDAVSPDESSARMTAIVTLVVLAVMTAALAFAVVSALGLLTA